MNKYCFFIMLFIIFLFGIDDPDPNYVDHKIYMDRLHDLHVERINYTSNSVYDFSSAIIHENIYGDLYLPNSCDNCPLMIYLHGSLGWKPFHRNYFDNMIEKGIAVFKIYSFESRGIDMTKGSQLHVTHQMMIQDAYSALNTLSSYPINMNKIGITGYSLGAGAALFAGWNVELHQKIANTNYKFQLHIPIYPPCFIYPEEKLWTDNAIVVMIGSNDQWTPLKPCIKLFSQIYNNTNHIYNTYNKHLVIYPEEHHSFDNDLHITTIENALNFENCEFTIDSNNDTIYKLGETNNNSIIMNTVQNRIKIFKDCAKLENHVIGYNNTATKYKAIADYIYYIDMYLIYSNKFF